MSTMQETASWDACSLLGVLGRLGGRGNYIIRYSTFKYTSLRTPVGVVWDGLALGTLDDILFIGHVIKNNLGWSYSLFGVLCMVYNGRNSVDR